jgi:hypothetical protein
MKVKLMTKWRNNELECCCPVKNQCLKNHNCEELEFILDQYEGINDCMKSRSYKRNKNGAIKQVR